MYHFLLLRPLQLQGTSFFYPISHLQSYNLISFIITKCPDIYCLLTFRVRQDIIDSLALVSPYVHVGSFDRPNLYYGAKCCDSSKDFIDDLCSQLNQRRNAGDSTIVYCATVRDAEDVRT
jgi:superfamily II DNA helicase RecQ